MTTDRELRAQVEALEARIQALEERLAHGVDVAALQRGAEEEAQAVVQLLGNARERGEHYADRLRRAQEAHRARLAEREAELGVHGSSAATQDELAGVALGTGLALALALVARRLLEGVPLGVTAALVLLALGAVVLASARGAFRAGRGPRGDG